MATDGNAVDIDAAIDSQPLGAYQIVVICLCALTVIFDGFDNQSVGLLAPSIAKGLGLEVARLGIVFSAGLFGWLVGALLMGPMADRFGRRRAIILSVTLFGALTLLATTATTLRQFVILWFVNGIGLGGAIPNAVALATEFAPRRLTAKVSSWVITGMPIGAILGGIASATVLPSGGWRPVMYIGGALPLALAVVLLFWLPESARFLITARVDPLRIRRLIQRIIPDLDVKRIGYFYSRQTELKGVPIAELFRCDRSVDTVLYWIAFFGNLMILYFVLNWFPAMLHGAGLPVAASVVATTLYSVGGAVGAAAMGYVMTAIGARVATVGALLLSTLLIGLLATHHSVTWLVWILVAVLGSAVQGAQAGLNGSVAAYYPTAMRSTGLGWALGIGRIGSVIGPLLGEAALLMQWPLERIFMSGMIPALVAAAAISAMAVRHSRAPRRLIEARQ